MRALLTVIIWCGLASFASAADNAQSRALGYSPDGQYFAFEQYGTQDGSGFGYADIFVIDTISNEWVKGTPVRVRDETDEGNVNLAMAKAMEKAAPILKSFKITAAYETLAATPFTQIGIDRRKVQFARYYDSIGNVENYKVTGSYLVEVKDVALPLPIGCTLEDGYTPVGMDVTVTNVKTGTAAPIFKDSAIPGSRNCPHAYDIEAIYAPATEGLKREPLIALIGVYSRGFEGSDRRIIAVPFELPE